VRDFLVCVIVSMRDLLVCVIAGFRREVDEKCALLGNYAASCVKFLPTFRENLSAPLFRDQECLNS